MATGGLALLKRPPPSRTALSEVELAGKTLRGIIAAAPALSASPFAVQRASALPAAHQRPGPTICCGANHSTQYTLRTRVGWERLRQESPGVYDRTSISKPALGPGIKSCQASARLLRSRCGAALSHTSKTSNWETPLEPSRSGWGRAPSLLHQSESSAGALTCGKYRTQSENPGLWLLPPRSRLHAAQPGQRYPAHWVDARSGGPPAGLEVLPHGSQARRGDSFPRGTSSESCPFRRHAVHASRPALCPVWRDSAR